MKRDAARKKVVEDLTSLGLLEKEEPYETQVGHSDRSKTPIEPYLSDQWFVKMAPLAEPALEVVRDGIIKFFPERHAQQYLAWLGEKRDWPISRQHLWWGHRIPVWTRDIITLWVARMVIAGLYNMGQHTTPSPGTPGEGGGEGSARSPHPNPLPDYRARGRELGIPFFHVAINPTILDGKGERMSKSKGNGVDPVEIIDAYGADALRFTLTLMATETQDARLPVKKDAQGRNTSEKFDIGRSFANKLWNAARFTLEHLQTVAPGPVDESKWSLADRWIVSRFSAAVAEADEALRVYRFDQYAKVCYDFFWRDFCDWYLETAKLSLKDSGRAGQTANVLAAVLDGALRLMHPMIPFVTETIWWKLNESRKDRGLPGRIDCPPTKRLILAAWPKVGPVDQEADATFAMIQEIVGAIRNFRNVHQIEQKKVLPVGIEPFDPEIAQNVEAINLLAGCQLQQGGKDTPRATVGRFSLFFVELLDKGAETQRVEKQRDELNRKIVTLNGRLKNAGYIAKAPPHLVEETKKQLADAEAELAMLS
jgi:valyl-tRNA synthetase